MSGITRQMADCLTVIDEMTVDGVPPSYAEIQAALGVSSKSRVFLLVRALEDRGHIRRIPDRARSIEIIHRAPDDLTSRLTSELLQMRKRIDAELTARATS